MSGVEKSCLGRREYSGTGLPAGRRVTADTVSARLYLSCSAACLLGYEAVVYRHYKDCSTNTPDEFVSMTAETGVNGC